MSVKLRSEPGPTWLESTCPLQPGVSVRLFKGPVGPRPWACVLQTSTCFRGLGASVILFWQFLEATRISFMWSISRGPLRCIVPA